MKNYCQLSLMIALLILSSYPATAQVLPKKGSPPQWIYGLTIEQLKELDVEAFKTTFHEVKVPITLRIVFQAETVPDDYRQKIINLYNSADAHGKRRFYIMGLLFDSQALLDYKLRKDSEKKYDCTKFAADNDNYNQRAKCFVEKLNDYVDIWEVGNEVNGEWADEKYNGESKKDRSFKGNYKATLKKIDTAIKLIPNNKPLALTVSYMPECGEWDDNAMDKWIKHFEKSTVDKIDYVLISYYEDKCNYKVLSEAEINDNVIPALRKVFTNQFIGFGELGYSSGVGESAQTCENDMNCYCSVAPEWCDEASNDSQTGEKTICRKSKIFQMQRYYRMKTNDRLFIGGGFWWNAGEDYIVPDFLTASKGVFDCLSTNKPCPQPATAECPPIIRP